MKDFKNKPTFMDFYKGGCEISLQVCIDFTESNGIVKDENSYTLHSLTNDDNGYY